MSQMPGGWPGGGGWGMGGFGIDWYITGEVCKLRKEEKTLLKLSPKSLIIII